MANTLKFGNGEWYGKDGSILAYNDEGGNYKPLPFDFSRSSTATRVNKEGLIETVGRNKPRVDYKDNSKGALLLEDTSTNFFQYSEDFNQSYWNHNADITTTNSSELAPNGGLNANLIEYDGSGYSFIRIYGSVPSVASTLSVFAKKGNWRYFGLRHFQGSGNDHTVFDFDTETFSNIASGQTASFEVFPNGWYKVKVTHPSPAANSIVGFAISNSSGAESNTTGGQVANVHLFGAQLEHKSYATSYIPTQGSTVTRVADTGVSTGDISSVVNSSEGVLYAEISALADDLTYRGISLVNGTGNNIVRFYYENTSNTLTAQIKSDGVTQATMTYTLTDITIASKICIKYKQNDFALWINGVEVDTDTSGVTPTGLNVLQFDTGTGNDIFYGRCKEIRIYDEALSDTELQALTQV